MLRRYDVMALKSLDIFSIHGFPVGLAQCESNLIGLTGGGGAPAAGGGWLNIVEKYTKAKAYGEAPFEIRRRRTDKGGGKTLVFVPGEWIGAKREGAASRKVDLACADAAKHPWPAAGLDAALTDPPYFGNVQYAELMDFCFVWLRRLMYDEPAFATVSTRHKNELTGNAALGRDLAHFTEGLAAAYAAAAAALKPGAPFRLHLSSQ